MSNQHDESTPSVSDPAKDDELGSDWTDEGGALPTGPATDPEASEEDAPPEHEAKVDQQDGGPGAQQEDGGDVNDVASGGVSEAADDPENPADSD